MPKYDIVSWDPVILKNETFPRPMVTFKPSDASGSKPSDSFVQYVNDNKGAILVTLSDTNSPYENTPLVGVVESSGIYPSYRPNFFNEKGYFTITLVSDWYGYPPNRGSMLIQGTQTGPHKLPEMAPPKFEPPKPIPFALEHYKEPGAVKTNYWVYLLVFLAVILLGLAAYSLS